MRYKSALLAGVFLIATSSLAAAKIAVQRKGGNVWLTGVKCFSFAERESSIYAAQEAIMQALGEDVSYDYQVGVSGLAFRMQVYKQGLCPSSPHAYVGFVCADRAWESLPWSTTGFEVDPKDKTVCDKTTKMIVDSIDRGIPVQYGREEDGLIIGYRKNGEERICLNPMRDKGKKSFIETGWPAGMGIGFYTDKKSQKISRLDLEKGSLKQALQMSATEGVGEYWCGSKAWDVFIDRIATLDSVDEKTFKESMLGNAWIYQCLIGHRRSAAAYLRMIAPDFPFAARPHIERAADLYGKIADQVLTDKEHCCITIAPYEWSLKPGEKWTSEMRADEVARLRRALPLERLALREISKALAGE